MTADCKLAIIVVTTGKYQGIKTLFDSIEGQTVKPGLAILVDANQRYSAEKLGKYSFPIKYVHTGPNSLTEARNIGIKNVPEDFKLVCFLDDDTALCDGALVNMFSFWSSASIDTYGAAFNIINSYDTPSMKMKELFLLNSSTKGRVLRSGFASSLYPTLVDLKTEWLSGGNTVWRKDLFSEYKFDENLKGYGFVDDLDFSYKVGKKYKLFVLAKARIEHFCATEYTKRMFQFGFKEVVSRYYFLRKHKELSLVLFYWAHLGLITKGLMASIIHFNFSYFQRACGNVAGVSRVLLFRNKRIRNS